MSPVPTRRRVLRRAVGGGVAAVVLAVVAVLGIVRGVVVAPSTGGLLLTPVPLPRLVGAWLTTAAVAGFAAVLTAVDAVAATRTLRALRAGDRDGSGPRRTAS